MQNLDGFLDVSTADVLRELDQKPSILLSETCGCGASSRSIWPIDLVDLATKQINTWRRFHVCSMRSIDSQPNARRDGFE